MEKVIIQPWVVDDLIELVNILFEKEYFGFLENAEDYVRTITKFIYTIPKQRRKETLNPLFGVYYCQYSPNNNTTYYICFDIENDVYLVKNIVTNHSSDYPKFIK